MAMACEDVTFCSEFSRVAFGGGRYHDGKWRLVGTRKPEHLSTGSARWPASAGRGINKTDLSLTCLEPGECLEEEDGLKLGMCGCVASRGNSHYC